MTKKEERHIGQRPLISEYDETLDDREERHRGMPPLADVKKETDRLGLPHSDAEAIYDSWLMSGFRSARGLKIASWKAAIRIWHRSKFFPSQKKPFYQAGELMTNEILDALAQNPAYKKIDVQKEAWAFKQWCEQNDKPKLVTSFIKSLNTKL
jgi:hypothetical protein